MAVTDATHRTKPQDSGTYDQFDPFLFLFFCSFLSLRFQPLLLSIFYISCTPGSNSRICMWQKQCLSSSDWARLIFLYMRGSQILKTRKNRNTFSGRCVINFLPPLFLFSPLFSWNIGSDKWVLEMRKNDEEWGRKKRKEIRNIEEDSTWNGRELHIEWSRKTQFEKWKKTDDVVEYVRVYMPTNTLVLDLNFKISQKKVISLERREQE